MKKISDNIDSFSSDCFKLSPTIWSTFLEEVSKFNQIGSFLQRKKMAETPAGSSQDAKKLVIIGDGAMFGR